MATILPSSLPTSTLWILLLLAFVNRPTAGADVALSAAWSSTLQNRIADIDENSVLSNQVISILNGFQSLNPPARESPDSKWVDLLASQVASLMQTRVEAAERLALEVERLYSLNLDTDEDHMYDSFDQSTWDPGFTSTLAFDPRYQTNVSFTYSTVRYPDFSRITEPDNVAWTKPLDITFRDNSNVEPALTNQYFASADGSLRAFPGGPWVIKPPPNTPASTYNDEGLVLPIAGFNARFSSWYVLGASGPKDVVLVLDSSMSMGNLYEVRKAAILVIIGLTSQDYVNVVTFNTFAVVASCWQNRLVRATEANKEMMISYLLDLEIANGKTNIEAGLRMATKLLEDTVAANQTSRCEQVLLLLTDGVTSASHFDIDNDVDARLFAYVLNIYTDTSPLQRLACANSGILIPIPNPSSTFTTMGSYYNVLTPGRQDASQIWAGPFVNQLTGTGLVLTVVRPCFDRSQSPPALIGMIGVDLPLEQIDALVRNYLAAPSYAFVVNSIGEALIHPLIPTGGEYKRVPVGIDIAELEGLSGDQNFTDVRNQLMRGTTGNVALKRVVRQLRGYDHFEGYVSWNTTSHYYFCPLFTGFSVAVVWTTILNKPKLPPINIPDRGPVTHVVPDAYHSTQRDGRTSFSVSAKGYCDPVWFMNAYEDAAFAEMVVSAVDQPGNSSCPEDLLQPEAKLAIQSTSHIDNLWNDTGLTHPEVRVRFIATHYSGVMRTFPGKTLTTKFDPTFVPWYRRALAYSGGLVASIPHTRSDKNDVLSIFDDTTNTLLLTRIVPYATPPISNGTSSYDIGGQYQVTYGVIGISMEYQYFSDMFLDVFQSKCSYDKLGIGQTGLRCLLMDQTGYLITHPIFLLTLPQQNESYIFIGKDEPLLTKTLIKDQVLVPSVSDDYLKGTKRVLTTYTVQDDTLTSLTDSVYYKTGELSATEDCLIRGTYFISKISSGSNMYLVVLNVTRTSPCAYDQTSIGVTPTQLSPCDAPILSFIPTPCGARSVTYGEMESIRGIQKCQSETNAVILGLLIPLGVGSAILCLVWLLRRRKRMRSMRAGMLVPNADSHEERNEQSDNIQHPDNPGNHDNEDPNAGAHNPNPNPHLPFVLPSHIHNINDIPIDEDDDDDNNAPCGSLLNNNNNNNNGNNSPSFVVDPQLHNANPISPPSVPSAHLARGGPSRSGLRMFNPGSRDPSASMHTSPTLHAASPNVDLCSSASSVSLKSSSNAYFSPLSTEADDDDDDNEEGNGTTMIPMQPISQSARSHNHNNNGRVTDSSEDDDEEDGDNDDDEKEGDDDDDDDDSVGDGSEDSGESERDRDPDDLFASMAREMGIPLPRTSNRP